MDHTLPFEHITLPVNLALAAALLPYDHHAGRCSYMATFSVATGLPFMLASLGTGTLMSMIGLADMTLLGLTFHPYLAFFVASGTCRLAAFAVGWRSV